MAEIHFNDEKEVELMNRLAFWLEKVKGYTVDIVVDGYAVVEVENMDEYKEFKADHMVGKKMIKDCIKFGF